MPDPHDQATARERFTIQFLRGSLPPVVTSPSPGVGEELQQPPPPSEKLVAESAESTSALTLQELVVPALEKMLHARSFKESVIAGPPIVLNNTIDGSSSTSPSSCEKLLIDIADSGSAHSLREPELSSLEELLDTTSLEESTTTSPWTVPKNTTDDSPLSRSSLGSKIWIRHCPNWYQVFYIRMDLRGSFWMYPDLGGPFQSLKEAEDTINHYLDELRRTARCRQGELSTVDRLIHEYKYYLDGTPKTDSSKNSVDEKHYLVEALLEQYNEDQKLSGNPTYELEGLMGQQWLYENQDHRWYYHFNFAAKKKEADGHSTCVLFFAEVSDIKTERACEVNCCCIIEHNDNGHCYGCRTNGSPAMRHPTDSDAYTCGHLDGYLPFGLQSSSSDEEKSEAMLRAMFKDRCDPDYRDKIRRFTPGRGMKRITLSAV
ncbi:hypothetical protein EJB05_46510 [Eragrostis curvula]|uniref:DUF3615 domain-containing protein n=2 Tax=Eragrostis curvula TaxID=38414 RepID=A0A5J9TN66_9POAL|nr:hypothetical protein EJB05_46510 [Eragrostis curvula]